jgi:hypothetical protein
MRLIASCLHWLDYFLVSCSSFSYIDITLITAAESGNSAGDNPDDSNFDDAFHRSEHE